MDLRVGLCSVCRHARTTGNRRGSVFYLCTMAERDPRLSRYPPLPLARCPAFQPVSGVGEPDSLVEPESD
jgi:hypothetical protein